MHDDLREAIFALGRHIRYVAVGEGQRIVATQREGSSGASAQSSDFYEELIVNPTLLTLTRQRGDLDCGGLRHVVVAYVPMSRAVAFELAAHIAAYPPAKSRCPGGRGSVHLHRPLYCSQTANARRLTETTSIRTCGARGDRSSAGTQSQQRDACTSALVRVGVA
jgi:hypothetical protein